MGQSQLPASRYSSALAISDGGRASTGCGRCERREWVGVFRSVGPAEGGLTEPQRLGLLLVLAGGPLIGQYQQPRQLAGHVPGGRCGVQYGGLAEVAQAPRSTSVP